MKFRYSIVMLVIVALLASAQPSMAQKKKKNIKRVYPVAIFPFAERGREVAGLGAKATDLLFASLVVKPEMFLVDREDLD